MVSIIENHDDLASYFHDVLDTVENPESTLDIGQELLDAIDEIKSGGGKRYTVKPKTPAAKARITVGLSQAKFAELLGESL